MTRRRHGHTSGTVRRRATLGGEAAMPGMKVTVSAAMRARDVSRPQPHHEAAAEENSAAARPASRPRTGTAPAPDGKAGQAAAPAPPPAPPGRPAPPGTPRPAPPAPAREP